MPTVRADSEALVRRYQPQLRYDSNEAFFCDSAAELCPRIDGAARQLHLGFPDPADATGSEAERMVVYRAVRDAIRAQIIAVLDE